MSAAIWLEDHQGEQVVIDDSIDAEFAAMYPLRSACGADDTTVRITYNLSRMLRAAGMPVWLELRGLSAVHAGEIWQSVLAELEADPTTYKAYNPANGWGDYDGAVAALQWLVVACKAHPDATIGGSL